MVKVGDSIPDVELAEGSPGNKVNLKEALSKGKGVIVGVPAAFSPGCSNTHIPGYINAANLASAGDVYVISVNDAFVMNAWGKVLDPSGKSNIHFLADPAGAFTEQWDVNFDASALLGNYRSKRYAVKVDGGNVVSTHVEPDNTSVNGDYEPMSAAEKVLA